jgi:2-polyprenyl-3-methyl-5-hydroxy-6-metoxy-1,4-benzoquinol methylase
VFSITFAYNGNNHILHAGERFDAPRDTGFRDTSSADLYSLVAEIDSGRPWREAIYNRYAVPKPWLHRIISASRRTAFFEDVLPSDPGLILDIGAGWGQTSRALAAQHPVIALEPVAERLSFIQAAARQDGVIERLACLATDYFDVNFAPQLNTICAIGVLEWVGAFQDLVDPQQRQRKFLRKIREELAPRGSLVLGIENRLGLKYLFGCPDDHIGVPHIACLPATVARQRWREAGHTLQSFTYSLDELTSMLRDAGFQRIDSSGPSQTTSCPPTSSHSVKAVRY